MVHHGLLDHAHSMGQTDASKLSTRDSGKVSHDAFFGIFSPRIKAPTNRGVSIFSQVASRMAEDVLSVLELKCSSLLTNLLTKISFQIATVL
jgi:hypothetical protein